MLGKPRVSWITYWWDENNVSLCGFLQLSPQKLLRLIGFPFQTQGRSQKCYLWVSHHIKGMSGYYSSHECVADICCFLWQPPSCNCPFSDSGKTARESVRQAEITRPGFDHHSRHLGFLSNMSFDDNILCPSDPCGGKTLFEGLDKGLVNFGSTTQMKKELDDVVYRILLHAFWKCFHFPDFWKFSLHVHRPVVLVEKRQPVKATLLSAWQSPQRVNNFAKAKMFNINHFTKCEKKKLMFKTYPRRVCRLPVISAAHQSNSSRSGSQASSHPTQNHKSRNPVLHLSKARVKNLDFCCFNIWH